MPQSWTRAIVGIAVCAALASCATDKEVLLPHDRTTMRQVWDQHTGAGARTRALYEARQELRRALTAAEWRNALPDSIAYTRTAQNEIRRQFHRLPNPDLVLYVFPHLSGDPAVPVPGYSTVFPLYERVEYAMPGERTEDY